MVAVDDGSPRERIEIELTEHADTSGGRWRRGRQAESATEARAASTSTTHVATPPGDAIVVTGQPPHAHHELAAWGTERRRLIVTGLAAGVIALFIGWALGRSGGPGATAGEASGDDPPATTAPATTEVIGSAVPSVAPADLPTTTRPFTPIVEQGPTTTVPEGWVDELVPIDPALAGTGVELVALTSSGLAVVDLTTGEMSTHPLRSRNLGMGHPIYAGASWILLFNPETQRARLFESEQPMQEFAFGSNSQLVHYPGADVFVAVEAPAIMGNESTVTWNVTEVPYDGSPATVVTTYELPANSWVQTPDPGGGVIVYGSSGGIYHADASGSQRLTTGQLLAVDTTTIVVVECGDVLDDCHVFVTDRATGERRVLEVADGSPARFEPSYSYWGTVLSTISPSGDHITVNASGPHNWSYGILSLVDGEFVPLSEPYGDATVSWSPDGRYAFYLHNGKISMYDTVAKTTLDDVAPIPQVISFTTRPVS
jgi:hypothetical protein